MPDFNFSTVGELIVHRIDSLDRNVRQTLNLCAVLGAQFELSELVTIYRKWLNSGEGEDGVLTTVKSALNCGVSEGIIEEVYGGGQLENRHTNLHGGIIEELEDEEENEEPAESDEERDLNIQYRFHHDMWRSNILKLMLDARKQDIHKIIAQSLEKMAEQDADVTGDFFFMIKLFGHWKASGDKVKATDLALVIGKSFTDACLNTESVKMFDEALSMWRLSNADAEEKMWGGKSVEKAWSESSFRLLDVLTRLLRLYFQALRKKSSLQSSPMKLNAWSSFWLPRGDVMQRL
jgi:hypothetical protein